MPPIVSDYLNIGRRELDGIEEVTILEDWQYDQASKKFYIKISIASESKGEIPNNSIWYAVVNQDYPKGKVKLYPSVTNSCGLTFQHQSNNGYVEKNGLWRKGAPCLDSLGNSLGKYSADIEPLKADERLLWNVKKLIAWIHDANNGKLVNNGDFFELPEFNITVPILLAFSEDNNSLLEWKSIKETFGIAELNAYKSKPLVYFIKNFRTYNGKIINIYWGKYLSQSFETSIITIWIMLNEVPVIKRWQAPNSLKELINACHNQDIDLMGIIEKVVPAIRNEKQHLLLLGFPIPERIGDENVVINWQAIKLPVISSNKKTAKGFRTGEKGWWRRDKTEILTPSMELKWLKSQNWNSEEITNRGRLNKNLTSKNTLIIGSGAIGASVAELLTRSGVTNITIMDDEILEIGNLSRHPLGLNQVGNLKSKGLTQYLNQINPHVKCEFFDNELQFYEKKEIEEFDLIIDCTGEDTVLDEIEKFKFDEEKIFASISIGFGAKRLYLFIQKRKKFKSDNFRELTSPWLKIEENEFSYEDLRREGVGCWSPVFPARYDDILLASSTAVKVIDNFLENGETELISIYEKYSTDSGIFVGYKIAE